MIAGAWNARAVGQHMRGVAIGSDLGTSDIRAALVCARRDVVAMPPRPLLIFRAITRDNGRYRVLVSQGMPFSGRQVPECSFSPVLAAEPADIGVMRLEGPVI